MSASAPYHPPSIPLSPNSTLYVQVPHSPFHFEHYRHLASPGARSANKGSSIHVSLPSTQLKENTPLAPLHCFTSAKMHLSSASLTPSTSVKRKLTDRDTDDPADDVSSSSKRARSLSSITVSTPNSNVPLKPSHLNAPPKVSSQENVKAADTKTCPEFPNGWMYCHQCCKKRDAGDVIQCTVMDEREVGKTKAVKRKRCVNKYCRACLKNRYNDEIDALKDNKALKPGHVSDAGYFFECPKCKDACNCPRCRKSKGLEPIGALLRKPLPKEPAVKNPKAKPAKLSAKAKGKDVKAAAEAISKKARPVKKVKALAPVKWTRVACGLDKSEVEERMHIREFLLRFHHLGDVTIPKPHFEELEQLNGNGKNIHGSEELDDVAWVSDACVKSTIMALLGLFALTDEQRIAFASEDAIQTLRTSGPQLSKIWGTLLEWQAACNPRTVHPVDSKSPSSPLTVLSASSRTPSRSGDSGQLSFGPTMIKLAEPRVLSLKVLTEIEQGRRATRGMTSSTLAGNGNSVVIVSSSQMVPVISSMIDNIWKLDISAMREDLDEGLKRSKEVVRQVRECVKGEGERWEGVRKKREAMKDKEKVKDRPRWQAARQLHKDILTALERSQQIIQHDDHLRFAPLATDPDGRSYYALSPGQAERDAAHEFVEITHIMREQGAAANSRRKMKHKGKTVKPHEREELLEFSWMILVWGRIPDAKEAYCPNLPGEQDEDESDDGDGMEVEVETIPDDPSKERWYAFSNPADIKHLAEWVAAEYGLEDDDSAPPEKNSVAADHDSHDLPMKRLVSLLTEFAELLEWRSLDDKYRLPNEPLLPALKNVSVNGVSARSSRAKA